MPAVPAAVVLDSRRKVWAIGSQRHSGELRPGPTALGIFILISKKEGLYPVCRFTKLGLYKGVPHFGKIHSSLLRTTSEYVYICLTLTGLRQLQPLLQRD